jgi:predicted alpha-1,6-mannanase (GH76 family)
MKIFKLFYIIALFPVFFAACGDDNEKPDTGKENDDKINWNAAADSSSSSLINSFWNASKSYFNTDNATNSTFQYWPNGHALEILVDAYVRTKDNFYKTYIDRWHDGVKTGNRNTFYNDYYDDMEWNAIAMLRAYKATNDVRYKDAALQVWEWIKEGWNSNAGGGISWAKGWENSKNACSNGPACILAARLYQEFGDESNKDWAAKIYNWEKSTLFNTNNGSVYDNINSNTGVIEKNWIFTYNQGTFIGSAVELHKIFGEKAYLNDAVLAANYTISTLVTNSVLKSEGTGDGGLFKGIFIRYFAELIQQERLDAADRKRYIQFLLYNAETLWKIGAVKPAVLFGPYWGTKPGSTVGVTEQMSGCMLIEAMALLENKGII